jgi:hypothetical protein
MTKNMFFITLFIIILLFAVVRSEIVETSASLSQARNLLAAVNVNDLVLFGGGYNASYLDRVPRKILGRPPIMTLL